MKATKKSPSAKVNAMTAPASLQLTAQTTIDLDAAAHDETGHALPRFRMVAYTGSPMRVGGWRYPVIIDLAGLVIPSQSRPIRFGHDPLSGVGHTDGIRVEQGQLVATGVVSRDTAAAREVVASSKNGFPWQASVGASVDEFEFVKENQKVTVNGQPYIGPLNVIRKATLGEISFVDLGADGATSASVAAVAEPQAEDVPMEDDTPQQPEGHPVTPTAPESSPPATADPASAAATCAATVDDIRAHGRRNRSDCRHPAHLRRARSEHRVAGHPRRLERTTHGTGSAASHASGRSRGPYAGNDGHGQCPRSRLFHGGQNAQPGSQLRRPNA